MQKIALQKSDAINITEFFAQSTAKNADIALQLSMHADRVHLHYICFSLCLAFLLHRHLGLEK